MTTLPPLDAKSPPGEAVAVVGPPPIEIAATASKRLTDQVIQSSVQDLPLPLSPGIDKKRRFGLTGTTAFLCSFVFHLILLLLLAIWFLSPSRPGTTGLPLTAVISESTVASLQVLPKNNSLEIGSTETTTSEVSISKVEIDVSLSDPVESNPDVIAEASSSLQQLVASSASGSISDMFRSSSTTQRSASQRASAAAANGGSRESEIAVERGLKWLLAHQRGDGAWSLRFRTDQCDAGCLHEGKEGDYAPAATGLALLSFLGAGYTHREGEYQQQLRKAIYYLLTRIEYSEAGDVGNLAGLAEHAMYNHGIATLALCEAYQMTNDKDLEEPIRCLINYIAQAQHDVGGWGYSAGSPGDLTISTWQVMAIKSAYAAGIRVPSNVMRQFDRFLDTQQSAGGAFYGYRGPGKQPGTTAMGLLLRMYRGWGRTDPRLLEGLNYLEKAGFSQTDVYFNFYATQTFFHQDGPAWQAWNTKMREFLVKTQESGGHQDGSWFMLDSNSRVGGRLYCTCMAILTLEVYYRYPPMFRELKLEGFEF